MGAVFPALAPGGYVYGERLYGEFARDLPGAILYLSRPDHLVERLTLPANGPYLAGLLVPVAFLPLLAPGVLLLAVQLPLNMVSSWPYAHEIRYHYVAPVIPFVFLALVRVLERGKAARHRTIALAALGAGILAGQVWYASPWLVPRPGQRWWRGLAADAEERREVSALLARIPADAAVSAHYRFLPHLARRSRLNMFPALGPVTPDAVVVDLDRAEADAAERAALVRLRASCREVARTTRGTVLLACPTEGGESSARSTGAKGRRRPSAGVIDSPPPGAIIAGCAALRPRAPHGAREVLDEACARSPRRSAVLLQVGRDGGGRRLGLLASPPSATPRRRCRTSRRARSRPT